MLIGFSSLFNYVLWANAHGRPFRVCEPSPSVDWAGGNCTTFCEGGLSLSLFLTCRQSNYVCTHDPGIKYNVFMSLVASLCECE